MERGFPEVTQITEGPKHHWFGYYDKLQFDPSSRYVLGMGVDFNGRSPTAGDAIEIGMVDLLDGNKWIRLGESRSWCWQQGCMLQWRPGSDSEVLWNDLDGDRFVCRVLNLLTGEMRTVPYPIYSVSPDGRTAVTPDFRRINHMRPGYGYPGLLDPNRDVYAPEDSGIWRVDIETGKADLVISVGEVIRIPYPRGDFSNTRHYFNHLLLNPDGTRFIFLHRWRVGKDGWNTRMLTASLDGTDIHVVDDYGETSHFIWRDPSHILAWAQRPERGWRFYLYEDKTENVDVVGEGAMIENGHCSYLPGSEWILNDTYPDKSRTQHLYLYHVPTGRKIPLGGFHEPEEYCGEWRCDLHPRFSPDRRLVAIDSAHGGTRQMYLVDISGVVKQS